MKKLFRRYLQLLNSKFQAFLMDLQKNTPLLLVTIYWWIANTTIGLLQLVEGEFFDDYNMTGNHGNYIRNNFEPPYEILIISFESLGSYDITEFIIYSILPFLIWYFYNKIDSKSVV